MDTLSRIRFFRLICGLVILLGAAACASRPNVTRQPSVGTASAVPTAETPFVMPTPLPVPRPVCEGAPASRLILQERGIVLPDDPRPVNMRRDPGTSSPVIDQIPTEAVFYVLDGPTCMDSYAWFQIKYANLEGWIAEGDQTSYYVDSYLPG